MKKKEKAKTTCPQPAAAWQKPLEGEHASDWQKAYDREAVSKGHGTYKTSAWTGRGRTVM
jgi:hypothetical protein